MTDVTERFDKIAPGGHPNVRPRDAATLILIDRSAGEPKVLLGRRHHSHVFLPGKFVFPGGRVDPRDRLMSAGTPLHPRVQDKLMLKVARPSPTKAQALALAAIRETQEETGLLLGRRHDDTPKTPPGPWSAFADARVRPDLGALHFITRAITPPGRARRFDTRFFAADASAIAHRIEGVTGPDAELTELVWVPLAEAKRLDLIAITEIALVHLQERIEAGFGHDLPVPFYRLLHGRRLREML
jgi:8-oxo-dGTP pyrophosphatase MutT (NUDIX family)